MPLPSCIFVHTLIGWLLGYLIGWVFILQLKVELEQARASKTELEAVASQKQDLLSQWESQIADVIQW